MPDRETIFKKQGKVFLKPEKSLQKAINLFKKHDVHRILDLGCGSGRHAVLLAKEGLDVHCIDISQKGLDMTKEWLESSGLKADLKQGSCYDKFPYKDQFFDAVVSTQVIHHNYHEKVKFAISEIQRVLKKDGLAFISIAAKKGKHRARKSKEVAPQTYIPLDGP